MVNLFEKSVKTKVIVGPVFYLELFKNSITLTHIVVWLLFTLYRGNTRDFERFGSGHGCWGIEGVVGWGNILLIQYCIITSLIFEDVSKTQSKTSVMSFHLVYAPVYFSLVNSTSRLLQGENTCLGICPILDKSRDELWLRSAIVPE